MKNLFIYYLVVFYLRVVKLTTLWDVINKGDKDNTNLFIVWYNRTLICLLGIDKIVVGNDKLNSIVSPSKDGKFLSDLMASFGHSYTFFAGIRNWYERIKNSDKSIKSRQESCYNS